MAESVSFPLAIQIWPSAESVADMIEAVIFDLYGTLIRLERNTKPYGRFARLVRPDDPQAVLLQSLLIDTRSIRDFAVQLGGSPSPEIDALDMDLRHDLLSARLFDDTVDTLAALRSQGLKLGLISNLAAPYKEPFNRFGLATYFDAILFSCDAGVRKPDPACYLKTCENLSANPASAIMVGDSLRSDYEGPRAVGMEALHLRRDGDGRSQRQVKTLTDLRTLLRK